MESKDKKKDGKNGAAIAVAGLAVAAIAGIGAWIYSSRSK